MATNQLAYEQQRVVRFTFRLAYSFDRNVMHLLAFDGTTSVYEIKKRWAFDGSRFVRLVQLILIATLALSVIAELWSQGRGVDIWTSDQQHGLALWLKLAIGAGAALLVAGACCTQVRQTEVWEGGTLYVRYEAIAEEGATVRRIMDDDGHTLATLLFVPVRKRFGIRFGYWVWELNDGSRIRRQPIRTAMKRRQAIYRLENVDRPLAAMSNRWHLRYHPGVFEVFAAGGELNHRLWTVLAAMALLRP